jgi:hypothetical protein
MRRTRQARKIFLALCANALLLLMILLALVSRDGRSSMTSAAFAQMQPQPPIAGGNGIYVMPAQLSPNTWGCYLLDNGNHTLCVYQYSPGERLLRFAAARDFAYDRQLSDFNTQPPTTDVKDLVDRQRQGLHAAPATPKSPEEQKEQ